MSIQLTIPEITSARITPNPANINSSVLIQVFITEKVVTLSEEKIYSGELYSGEGSN